MVMVCLLMRKYLYLIVLLWGFCIGASAQYADTLTVDEEDVRIANLPENINMFASLSNHVDPQLIYAQAFWASYKFDDKYMRHNNPFSMRGPNGKLRKFKDVDEAVSRMILAVVDYDIQKESYTDYLEKKPKSNWSPRMSKKLLQIYRELYGTDYDYKKQLHKFKSNLPPLRFAKGDSISTYKNSKPYLKEFAIGRKDKNFVQMRNYMGPLAVLASKVDTQMVFVQVLWATDHFNSKQLAKSNNYFQIVDDEGNLKNYESPEDAIADYLMLIIDYDKRNESYLAYLERRTNGHWNKKMSDKMRALYKSLYRKTYDESKFKGYKATVENSRTKTSRSRTRL